MFSTFLLNMPKYFHLIWKEQVLHNIGLNKSNEKNISHCFQRMTFRSSWDLVVHCSSDVTLVWWIQGVISANFTAVGVVRSTSQGSVHFFSSWLSGDAVVQVLSSTLPTGSKECSQTCGRGLPYKQGHSLQLRSDFHVAHFLYLHFLIYTHISHPKLAWNSRPHTISWENWIPREEVSLILSRTIGKAWSQWRWLSWHSLAIFFFKVWFIFSTFPEAWGLHAMWSLH